MNRPPTQDLPPKPTIPLWQAILLTILLSFIIVALFGVLIYLFSNGVQQQQLPLIVYLTIFVIITGIFAWLLKRLTDIVSGMSQLWFPEDEE